MSWLLFALALSVSAVLWWLAAVRAQRLRPIREGAPTRAVAELEPGRFRIVGKVVPTATTQSTLDGLECVFLEHAEYVSVHATVRRETEHSIESYPFFIDDGSGRAFVDPAAAIVDAVTLWEDGGLTAERRVRAGEEIEVVATFTHVDVEEDGGPYRGSARVWAATDDAYGPPKISYRTQPDMVMPSDDLTAFLRGAGVIMAAVSGLIGTIALL